jgi:hypothetical protein
MLPSSSTTACKRPLDIGGVDERERKKVKNESDVSSDDMMAQLPPESRSGHGSWPSGLERTQVPDNQMSVSAPIQFIHCEFNDVAGDYTRYTNHQPHDGK